MLKVEICLAWLIISCGQIMFWWRRDNIFGYLQAGFFFASIAIPVLATSILDDLGPEFVNQYANIMVVGAFAYLAGLCYGAAFGRRVRPRVTFACVLDPVPPVLVKRTRQLALAGLSILCLSFLLLGFIPYFAADRVSAKYGVGLYRAGFSRGALVLHVGLIIAGTVLPVLLALCVRHRNRIDIILVGVLSVGLTVTLSRGNTFYGPVVFLLAVAIERRWRPWRIVCCTCLAFVAGSLVNEIVLPATAVTGATFASRVAGSAPDIVDNVSFLRGYDAKGSTQVGLRPILAGFNLEKGQYNASTYALRLRTGLPDISGLAAGGLRLPAPVWGYSSFGYPGVIVWSLLSGIAIGWGTTALRRSLSEVPGGQLRAINLILAWVFFNGTFLVLGEFYFFERVGVISFGMAAVLCLARFQKSASVANNEAQRAATTR